MKRIPHFIDGSAVESTTENVLTVMNPATGEQTASVPIATPDEVEAAVNAARKAFPAWSETTPIKRARIMFRFRELLEANQENIAQLITSEHGKVLSDAMGEVTRGLEVVEYVTGIPHILTGLASENVGTGVDSYGLRYPLGVCVGISPFNFPAMVPMWMFPVAIACGNTFILKPSEKTPSAALFIAKLLAQAGLPAGVFNVVHGDKSCVDQLLDHPEVKAISFVGSTPVAEYIYAQASGNGKRVQALGGAKNHMVIMPGADIDEAADALMGAAYGSAGERCMAVSVAVAVGDDVADTLVAALKRRIKDLKVGPGTQADADMGPLISKQHLDKVTGYVSVGQSEGADLVVDGRSGFGDEAQSGYFLGPSLFDGVSDGMRILNEEIFGPVLSIVRRSSLDEALDLINAHEYGNGAVIYTPDGEEARRFTREVFAGMVGVNVPIPVPVAYHSFGGWKRSLFGDHHMHGAEGVRFYTRLKTISTRWPKSRSAASQYAMPTLE
nr:CoA-acylating methylmalonate-semialdehyde dehydrogenase [uncultured Hyphomonas sp.]